MVEPGVGAEVVEAAEGAGLRVDRSEGHHADARRLRGARAHRARLECHDERVAVEAPRSGGGGRVTQCEHLGVCGRVGRRFPLVVTTGDDGTIVGAHDHCADRDVSMVERPPRLLERRLHRSIEHRARQIGWRHGSSVRR